jgi:hypothetical protein
MLLMLLLQAGDPKLFLLPSGSGGSELITIITSGTTTATATTTPADTDVPCSDRRILKREPRDELVLRGLRRAALEPLNVGAELGNLHLALRGDAAALGGDRAHAGIALCARGVERVAPLAGIRGAPLREIGAPGLEHGDLGKRSARVFGHR